MSARNLSAALELPKEMIMTSEEPRAVQRILKQTALASWRRVWDVLSTVEFVGRGGGMADYSRERVPTVKKLVALECGLLTVSSSDEDDDTAAIRMTQAFARALGQAMRINGRAGGERISTVGPLLLVFHNVMLTGMAEEDLTDLTRCIIAAESPFEVEDEAQHCAEAVRVAGHRRRGLSEDELACVRGELQTTPFAHRFLLVELIAQTLRLVFVPAMASTTGATTTASLPS